MASLCSLFFLALFLSAFHAISSVTDFNDAAVLRSLKENWENVPPSWKNSSDPCGAHWEGVECNNSRVVTLQLTTMNLKGTLEGDIGGLTELRSLDLSFNPYLTGPLSPRLGDLQNLNILILAHCSFSGSLPEQLGNLKKLAFLALNSNYFTGRIPPSLGNLSNLYWLDLADNQLSGSLPVSITHGSGLDQLLKAKHFHLNKNKLSGPIPPQIFSPEMALIHVLFDGNQFTGTIPQTLGLVRTLEVLRLEGNSLGGRVPSNLNNLTNLHELNLACNKLSGPLPDLSGMDNLNYVDLGNNSFSPSEAPLWLSTLPSLTTLVMEFGSLEGPVPEKLLSLPRIQQLKLRNNAFNGTLSLDTNIGPMLQLVDLQNNQISSVSIGSAGYKYKLILVGNPICNVTSNADFCHLQQQS